MEFESTGYEINNDNSKRRKAPRGIQNTPGKKRDVAQNHQNYFALSSFRIAIRIPVA
jgi:hypothetical protein